MLLETDRSGYGQLQGSFLDRCAEPGQQRINILSVDVDDVCPAALGCWVLRHKVWSKSWPDDHVVVIDEVAEGIAGVYRPHNGYSSAPNQGLHGVIHRQRYAESLPPRVVQVRLKVPSGEVYIRRQFLQLLTCQVRLRLPWQGSMSF